jgi:hypothetical protein
MQHWPDIKTLSVISKIDITDPVNSSKHLGIRLPRDQEKKTHGSDNILPIDGFQISSGYQYPPEFQHRLEFQHRQ